MCGRDVTMSGRVGRRHNDFWLRHYEAIITACAIIGWTAGPRRGGSSLVDAARARQSDDVRADADESYNPALVAGLRTTAGPPDVPCRCSRRHDFARLQRGCGPCSSAQAILLHRRKPRSI
jgi:hypothetical protein